MKQIRFILSCHEQGRVKALLLFPYSEQEVMSGHFLSGQEVMGNILLLAMHSQKHTASSIYPDASSRKVVGGVMQISAGVSPKKGAFLGSLFACPS